MFPPSGLAGRRHRTGRQDDRLGAHWNLHQRQQLVRAAAAGRAVPLPLALCSAVGALGSLCVFRWFFFFLLFCRTVVMGGVKAYGSYPVWSVSAQSRGSQWAVGSAAGLGPRGCFFRLADRFFIFECCTMRDFIFTGTPTMTTLRASPIGAALARGPARPLSNSTTVRPSAVPGQKRTLTQPPSSPASALAAHLSSRSHSFAALLTLFARRCSIDHNWYAS